MKKAYIAILCGALGAIAGSVAVYVDMKETEVQQVPATVTRMQWACRTTVQESYVWMQPIMVGKIVTMIPHTEWRNIVYDDTFGEGLGYACPRFTLTASNQREVFGLAFFVTFADRLERAYEYRPDDYDAYKSLTPRTRWMLGLNQAGEVVDVHPALQEQATSL